MSVLETPRIVFRGRITWDSIVTNNTTNFYDVDDSETQFQPGETVAEFREHARQAVAQGASWNAHGTHRSQFFETRVTGVDLGDGVTDDDPFVGVPVDFLGMLVDIDPYGSTSSQLFFDTMRFGIDGGCRVLAPRRHRMTARRINFARNLGYAVIASVGSVIWQTSFTKESLQLDPHGSPALHALAEALKADDVAGLTVRWNAYRTVYFDTKEMNDPAVSAAKYTELAARIKAGGFHPNPARSEVVGVLGLWRRGEPPSVPGDRILASQYPSAPKTKASPGGPPPMGSAFARVQGNRLTVDLGNSVPETDYELTKHDYGAITLGAKDPTTGAKTALEQVEYPAYDKAAYDASAGILSFELTDAQAAATAGDLFLTTQNGGEQLAEQPLLACADEPNIYLDQAARGLAQTAAVVRIFERGAPPKAPVQLTVAEAGSGLASSRVFTSDAHGVVKVPLAAVTGGVTSYELLPGTNPVAPGGLDPQTTSYLWFRVLPVSGGMERAAPTWANVHRLVLRNWEAMAPCMDNWLRLGDPEQVKAYAPLLRKLTAADAFEDYRFMPVTRGMTPSQRGLLHRWLDAIERGAEPEAAAVAEAPSGPPDLSRAFRKT